MLTLRIEHRETPSRREIECPADELKDDNEIESGQASDFRLLVDVQIG